MKIHLPLSLFSIVLSCTLILGCKKKDDNHPDNTSGFFIEGRGLRKIHVVNHPSAGNFSGFGSASMMLKEETLDWTFGWYSSVNTANSYQPYRRRININTGDTFSNPGVPSNTPLVWLNSPDYYLYGNGTNNLCWRSTNDLMGEGSGLPFTFFGEGKVYDEGQMFSYNATSGYIGFSNDKHTKPVSTRFRRDGFYIDTNYLMRNYLGLEMTRCMDMEMTKAGEILMFTATGDSIQVRRFSDNVVIAGVPCTALNIDYSNNTQPYCGMETRRSADGNTITGFIFNNRVNPAQSTTFVYNVALNRIELKLNALPVNVSPLPVSYQIVFDDVGNVYYPNEPTFIAGQAYGGITKQTPGGNVVLCERFMNVSNAVIDRIFAIGNKLFAVLLVGEYECSEW